MAHDPIAYTVPVACKLGGIGLTKLYELMTSGELPSVKVGRRRLIMADDLRALLERNRVVKPEPAQPVQRRRRRAAA